jgi:hypothetical protein
MQAIAFGLPQGARRISRKIPDKGKSSQPPRAEDVNRSLDERLLPIGYGEKKENCLIVGECGLLRPWDSWARLKRFSFSWLTQVAVIARLDRAIQ